VTADTLQAFAISLVPFSVYLYVMRAFYALQDTRTPFVLNAFAETRAPSTVAIGATVSSDAPYAAIHEYGGVIPAREILPQSARALAFPWRGQQRFLKRVQLPAVTMPERSFMRSALEETAPDIRAALARAAFEAVQA